MYEENKPYFFVRVPAYYLEFVVIKINVRFDAIVEGFNYFFAHVFACCLNFVTIKVNVWFSAIVADIKVAVKMGCMLEVKCFLVYFQRVNNFTYSFVSLRSK